MKEQLKLWKVTIYEKNPHTMNDVAIVEVIMLDVDGFSVMDNAKEELGYSEDTTTSVEELLGPFDSGYLISYKALTDASPHRAASDVIDEFDALFKS